MPDMSGVEVLRHIKETDPSVPVIMVTAYASAETAVEALRLGAYDYLTKPFKLEELKANIRNALEKVRLKRENETLKRELKKTQGLDSMLGGSRVMLELFEHIKSVATTNSTVLITGESGTGKELAAKAIHVRSPRVGEPFVSINCGAVPETLLESELFGHLKGSFTGATTNHKGLFEVAHRGTILLDEIAEMSPTMQVKFLRVLQEKKIRRIGSTEEFEVDVRILAATNKDLERGVQEKTLSRGPLLSPQRHTHPHAPAPRAARGHPGSSRRTSWPRRPLPTRRTSRRFRKRRWSASKAYDWPGNVRELENVIERAVALEPSGVVLPERLPGQGARDSALRRRPSRPRSRTTSFPDEGVDFDARVASLERTLLTGAMEKAGGVQTKAARLLEHESSVLPLPPSEVRTTLRPTIFKSVAWDRYKNWQFGQNLNCRGFSTSARRRVANR